MTKKHILITGVSGTVGFEVLLQLINNENYNITIFDKETKKSSAKLLPYKEKVNLIFGDISVLKDLESIKNIDVAIHLAAIIPPVADDFPELAKNVNFIGTQNLIKQLEQHSPNAFLMYSSSISVYGDRIENPYIKVDDVLQPSPKDYYAETKIRAEIAVQNSKLDYTIFRLAAIMETIKYLN